MKKVVTKEEFREIRIGLKQNNNKIILCHGVFDLIHPGHILHFEEAKSLGEVLVVSITSENYVRKGPGRPYFNDELRLKFLSALECIDYVLLSEGYTVDDIIEVVEPDLYVKGQEYANAEDDITGKISEEAELVQKHGGELYYTQGEVFSSTKLLNNEFSLMTDEVKNFMLDFKTRHTMDDIKNYVSKMESLKVLVVGDVIIDDYVFCNIQGLMSKDMGYSARYIRSEQYLGGSLAIARHIASFTDNVTINSVVGTEKSIHSRLLNDLSRKMLVDVECSSKFETIVKKRYITQNEKREEVDKIFVINNLPNPMAIDEETMARFSSKLKQRVKEYDLVVLCDFGHGLITQGVMDIIEQNAKFLALNCQTNSSNYGTNLITKYKRAETFSLDEKELKLAFSNYSSQKSEVETLQLLAKHLNGNGCLTQGAKGAMAIDNGKVTACPAFTLKVKDTIGAGDAFFSLTSLCAAIGAAPVVGVFMGNIAGALAANIVGNKESIEKVNVLKYANTLLNV